MRVYQINVVCGAGSTGRIAVDLSRAIQAAGGECRIAYGRGTAPEGVDAIKISNPFDMYRHALMTRLTDRHGLYSKGATLKLIKDIQKYSPDIVHLHNIHGYYVNYEMLFDFLQKYNRPVVWTLHDCWAFTGHCAHYDAVGCNRWQSGCNSCPQKKVYPGSLCRDGSDFNYNKKKQLFNSVQNLTVVTVSDWLKEQVQQSFLQRLTIRKISNGIDLTVMHPVESSLRKQYDLQNKRIVLGVASVWGERKGLKTFYELAKRLPEEYKIVMIGLNERQMKEKPDNILGFSRTADAEELAAWYSAADIYVNASVEETMGLTTVESMACGTPAIVMNATACPEPVNESCGRVVEPGDLEQLVEAICSLHKDARMSENCMARARDYEKEKQYEEYVKLYREILDNN